MGPWSVRHWYQLLRGPLRRAVKDRVVSDPCIDIALPKRPDLRKTFDDVLTAQEVDALVARLVAEDGRYAVLETNGRYTALVFMGAWLGPRWNEALGLRVCDLNPLRHELALGRVVVNQNGSRTFTERLSKTEDARTVPVPAPVMEALQEHLAVYCAGTGREDFLFDAGLTLFEVQQRLGHKSPTLTAEIYTHLMRERFDEGRTRMEDDMAARRLIQR